MGKKRVIKQQGAGAGKDAETKAVKLPRQKISSGILYVQSTYNNTAVSVTDKNGNVIMWSTSGSLGFKGAKKGTPFAASNVANSLAEKAQMMGLQDVDVVVKGVGAGREAAIRSFVARGIKVNTIRDITPIPHNGPKPKKPRRV